MSRGASDPPSPAGTADGPTLEAADGHRFALLRRAPPRPRARLLWLPALGVAARHYLPFAEALAARGVAVSVHEWRGHGSSTLRAGRHVDWGYRTLLEQDLPVSLAAALGDAAPGDPAREGAASDAASRSDRAADSAPRIVGGHSLGGQLAALALALSPDAADRLWLVASGAPWWRSFPGPRGWMLPWAYRFLWWLAEARGALPGRAVGFGGREARGVMRDWARSGLSGRYAAAGMAADLEAALAGVRTPVDALRLTDDWLVPDGSLRFLLDKMQPASVRTALIAADALGARADHFAWMRRPDAVAEAFVRAAGIADTAGIADIARNAGAGGAPAGAGQSS